MFVVVTMVFLFYLCYSFFIGSNVKSAIIIDFVTQYKPYLGLFCVYAMKPEFPKKYRKLVREICLVLGVCLFLLGLTCLFTYSIILSLGIHPSRLATSATVVAMTYLYCSDYTWKDKIVFVLLMAIGIFSGRSKAYGFFIICAGMVLALKPAFTW